MSALKQPDPVKIVFKKMAHSFPPVCSCCLAPTTRTAKGSSTRTIGVPMVAAVKKTFHYEFPFCEACAGLKQRVHAESGFVGCLPAVGSVIVLAGGAIAGLRGSAWTACIILSVLGVIAALVMTNIRGTRARKRVLEQNPGHPSFCTGMDPVDLCAWESFDSAVFEVHNPDFARAVVEAGRAVYQVTPEAK